MWNLSRVSRATENKSLYTFAHAESNWIITVFAKDEVEARYLLSKRIEKEKNAINLRPVGSRRNSIDDWMAIEI